MVFRKFVITILFGRVPKKLLEVMPHRRIHFDARGRLSFQVFRGVEKLLGANRLVFPLSTGSARVRHFFG